MKMILTVEASGPVKKVITQPDPANVKEYIQNPKQAEQDLLAIAELLEQVSFQLRKSITKKKAEQPNGQTKMER